MYFESHAHYDDKRFDADRAELLSELLPGGGVEYIVNAGADMKSTREGIRLAETYDYVYAACGIHPHDAKSASDEDLSEIERLCAHPKAVAVGEIGLDFHYDYSDRETQRRVFRSQLEIAKRTRLPVIIHSREAHKETFDIIKESGAWQNGGVVHCFSGSAELALDYVKLGMFIGFGGAITFKNAKTSVAAAAAVPAENILIETDCPYISPEPLRGKRNDSRNLRYICQKLADIRRITHEEAAQTTLENAKRLFFRKS